MFWKPSTACITRINQPIFIGFSDRYGINGSQLAKNEKEYSSHAPAIKFIG